MQSSHLRILGEKPIRWLTKEIIKRSMRKVREYLLLRERETRGKGRERLTYENVKILQENDNAIQLWNDFIFRHEIEKY